MNWYPLMYALAIAAGSAVLLEQGFRRKLGSRWNVAVLAWSIGGVIGASVPYQLFGDAVTPRTAVGAVAGATIALFLAASALGFSPWSALDSTATAIPLAGAVARLGCFAAECCRGIATSLPIGIVGDDGIRRHPAQLYEAGLDVLIALAVSRGARRRLEGHRFLVSLSAMSVGRFAIEFLRDSDRIGPLSLAQWVTGPAAIVALIIVRRRVSLRKPQRRTVALTALALQMPMISSDTLYPRNYVSGGVAWFGASFDWLHDTGGCDVRERYRRTHTVGGGAAEIGYRRQISAERGFGFRLRPFSASETASESRDFTVNGGPVPGPVTPMPGYTVKSRGATLAADLDYRYLGLTLGGTFGQFYPLLEGNDDGAGARTAQSQWPSLGLRLGTQRRALEIRVGDEAPTGAPLPGFTVAFAGGNGKDTRVRIGTSDMGPFVTIRHVTAHGLELDPMVGSAHQGWLAGLMIKQWFRTDQKPR